MNEVKRDPDENKESNSIRKLAIFRSAIDTADWRYTTLNSSKGSMLRETLLFFNYLAKNQSITDARSAVLYENILSKQTRQNRKKYWEMLRKRYFPDEIEKLELHPIFNLFKGRVSDLLKRWVLYYHFALSDLLLYEIITRFVYDSFVEGKTRITPRLVSNFVQLRKKIHPETNSWSLSTENRMIRNYLAAMRDFGILQGSRNKRINKPTLSDDIILYVLTFLKDCGKLPKEIIECHDFRLFLLPQEELESRLVDIALRSRIAFQKSGHLITLTLPWESTIEYIRSIG